MNSPPTISSAGARNERPLERLVKFFKQGGYVMLIPLSVLEEIDEEILSRVKTGDPLRPRLIDFVPNLSERAKSRLAAEVWRKKKLKEGHAIDHDIFCKERPIGREIHFQHRHMLSGELVRLLLHGNLRIFLAPEASQDASSVAILEIQDISCNV